jgi:CBS domain containing-hemolysin-like protein
VGERAEDDYAAYTVLKVDGNRIDKLRIDIKPKPDEEDEEA